MENSQVPEYLDEVRTYRLNRVREELRHRDYAAIVLYDPLNIRYATDVCNMQIWCMHNENRYVFVPADGPVVLFESDNSAHLAESVPTVNEIRPATAWYYFNAGDRYRELAKRWAAEIGDLVSMCGSGNRRVAIDRTGYLGTHELEKSGIEILDGFEVMEHARTIKSPGEIDLMRHAMRVCEHGIADMQDSLLPGITENELWALLHATNIASGGEWIEARLLSSGPRTNPWYREASFREIRAGDIVAFDTDMIGPYGYCADISRTWICGNQPPTSYQKKLHARASEQIEFNTSLIRPGITFRELAEKAWPIPDDYLDNRYSCIGHGVGLCDEYPSLWHLVDWEDIGYDGVIQAGMVLSLESYIGERGGPEGVKLEEQLLVTEHGCEPLSSYALDLVRS